MNEDSSVSGKLLSMYEPTAIAKYYRLSLADEDNSSRQKKKSDESESIMNQRKLMNEFINRNGNKGEKCKEFIDDGVSGTNFDRPGWNSLQEEMEDGKIKVVITKNLSRLGRSNFECNYYLDYYFPHNGIRYIAIQEQIDTQNSENSNNEYAALNNFINEKYSRDLSKNLKKVYRMKQQAGEYMGGKPLYGYKKDPNNKHKFIIDEESSNVVRRIYHLYLETHSKSKVAKILTQEKIPIPEVYKKTRRGLNAKFPYEWNMSTISSILKNRMYIGDMVQNVYSKKSFREKKLIKNKKDDWIIVEQTHEAIVDKETFDRVQNIMKANYRQPIKPYERLFGGIMFCYECGHKIGVGNPKKDDRPIEQQYVYTYCNFYRKNSTYNRCSPHTNNYNKLEDLLLSVVRKICNQSIQKVNYEEIIKERKENLRDYASELEKKVRKLELDMKEIDVKEEKLYLDRLNDIITPDMYKKLTVDFEKEKNEKRMKIEELRKKIGEYRENNSLEKILEPKKVVEEYMKSRKNSPREFILKLIDRIEIHEDKNVDIYFKLRQLEQVV